MESTFTTRCSRHLYLIICLLVIFSVLVTAQEDCVTTCTKNSGINECVGSTPHDDAAWAALDVSTQECYCAAAVYFSGCSPGCSTQGFGAEMTGRLFGQWRYVNKVCQSEVAAFTSTALISTNPANFANNTTTAASASTTVSPRVTVNATSTPGTTKASPAVITSLPTGTVIPLQSPTESPSSNVRTIVISVSLVIFGAITIGIGLWLLFRKRRRNQIRQNIYDTRDAMVVVAGPDELPMDPSAPNFPPKVWGDLQNENVKRWIEDQENSTERDAMTETLSVGYTLWTDTDLCVTEMGAEDSRDMETIAEDPDEEGLSRPI